MVVLDSSFDGIQLEGSNKPSCLKNGNVHVQNQLEITTNNLVNGVHNIGNQLTTGIQSIPPQVQLMRDKIVNNRSHYFLFDEKNQVYKQSGEGGEQPVTCISYKDSSCNTGFKPIGIKNNDTVLEYSNCSVIEKPRFRSFSSPTQLKLEQVQQSNSAPNLEKIVEQYTSNSPLITSSNFEERVIQQRIRSMSLTSIEKVKQIGLEKERNNEPIDYNDIINYVDYQERLEQEELERIDKNSSIIAPNLKDSSYSALEIYDSDLNNYYTKNSHYNTFPRSFNTSPTNSTYSVPSTPIKSLSPTPQSSCNTSNSSSSNSSTNSSVNSSPTPQRVLKRSNSISLPKSSSGSSLVSPRTNISSPLTIKEEENSEEDSQKKSQTIEKPNVNSKHQFLSIHLQKSPSTSSLPPREMVKSPVPNRSASCISNSISKSSIQLSSSSGSIPSTPTKPKGLLKSSLVKSSSGNTIPNILSSSSSSSKSKSKTNNDSSQDSFQIELRSHLELKRETSRMNLKEKMDRFERAKSNLKPLIDEPASNDENRIKVQFILPTNSTKKSRYFDMNDKIQSMKEYIEYLSITETNLFGHKFKNNELQCQILDCDFLFSIMPTQIKIQNFNVTFKDIGLNPKLPTLININVTSKNIELR